MTTSIDQVRIGMKQLRNLTEKNEMEYTNIQGKLDVILAVDPLQVG